MINKMSYNMTKIISKIKIRILKMKIIPIMNKRIMMILNKMT